MYSKFFNVKEGKEIALQAFPFPFYKSLNLI